ncbi:hypothetical protein [Pseudomonas sp. CFBP 8771]|nr:hypothetical protein [Pseudomonas sp. CFBP 8771]
MHTAIDFSAGLGGWAIVWLCLQLPLGMLVGRFIASADVIAK